MVILSLSLATALLANGPAPLGTEQFGNEPLSPQNYTDWPGVVPVVNDPSRVYCNWVNGNEHLYYRGDARALNAALRKFAQLENGPREVVLRPGPGRTKSFEGKPVAFDWMLHLVGGIAGHLATLEKGDRIWSRSPVLHVYLGDRLKIGDLDVPDGIRLIGLDTLKARNLEALGSANQTVRGWGLGHLAELDPYDPASVEVIVARLKDQEDWVRLNAAGALATFGLRAIPATPALGAARENASDDLRQRIDDTLKAIDAAENDEEAARAHRDTMEAIARLLKARAKG